MFKISIVACLVIASAVLSLWVAHGSNIYTKDKVSVVVKSFNPNFGSEEEHIEWKDEFHLGLDIAGPVSALAVITALGLYIIMRRRGNRDLVGSIPA